MAKAQRKEIGIVLFCNHVKTLHNLLLVMVRFKNGNKLYSLLFKKNNFQSSKIYPKVQRKFCGVQNYRLIKNVFQKLNGITCIKGSKETCWNPKIFFSCIN